MAGNSKRNNNTDSASTRTRTRNKKKTQRQMGGGSAPTAIGSGSIAITPGVRGGPRGRTAFSNTEFVTDVTIPASGDPVASFRINPTDATAFPWLSRVAIGFEMYRFTKLVVSYNPFCPTTTAGLVAGAFEYDATDLPPTTKQQISAMDGSARANVWGKGGWVLKAPTTWYYANPDAGTGDSRLNDTARFFYSVFGGTTPGQSVGEFTVSYTIEFDKPEMSVYTSASSLVNVTGSTLSNLAGSSTAVAGDTVFTPSTGGSGVLNLNAKLTGQFIVEYVALMTSTVAPVAGIFTSVVQTRAGVTVTGSLNQDQASAFTNSASYYGVGTFTVKVNVGDILSLTAAGVFTALQLVRFRVGTYKITNG